MNRREFAKYTAMASSMAMVPNVIGGSFQVKKPFLAAYYFRAHMYTCVPKQVREDMQWMADIGTKAVCVAILEQDLFAAVENVNIIANESEKLGMELHIVPSRWAGLFAGSPKVPSLFTSQHPESWILKKDGTPYYSSVSGPIGSIFHPATMEMFDRNLEKAIALWPVKGVIWDEPKFLMKDYSEAAIAALSPELDWDMHKKAFTDFISNINGKIKSTDNAIKTQLFAYANLPDDIIEALAKSKNLNYFGCDGRPWYPEDGGKDEGKGKTLLGKNAGERFLKIAKQFDKKSYMLIENHNLAMNDLELMDKRLKEVISLNPEILTYYYYPRNVAEPEKAMQVIKKHLANI